MEETKNVKALKKQLAAAIAMVCVAAVALGSSTYAWFVTNNKVDATTTTEGYTGDTYCKDCGKLIASGTKIEKLPSKSDSPKSDEKAEVKKPDNNTTATAKNTEKKISDSKKTKSKKTKENTADVAKTSEKETEKATEKASETELVTETESESEITETTEQTEKKDTMKDTKKEEVKKSSGVPKAAAVVVVVFLLYRWREKARAEKRRRDKEMEDILQTPLDKFSDEDEAENLAKKYEKKDEK